MSGQQEVEWDWALRRADKITSASAREEVMAAAFPPDRKAI
jgi:hypothetical protein